MTPRPVLQQVPVCVLIVLWSVCVLRQCRAAEQQFCVQPDNQTDNNLDCHNLSFYTENVTEYFQSDTRFEFRPGQHYLRRNVSISNIEHLELVGAQSMVAGQLERLVPSSQVVCPSYGASLQFVNIKNLTITNLLFSGCGGSIDSRRLETPHATLAMMDVVDVRISQIVIQNGTGVGLFGINVQGHSVVSESAVLFNKGTPTIDGGNVYFYYEECGNMTTDLLIEKTLVFGGYSDIFWVFTSLSGLTLGVSYCTNLSLTVRSCNLTSNIANSGWGSNMQIGIMSYQVHPNVSIVIDNTQILNGLSFPGQTTGFGGGLYIFSDILLQFHPPQLLITGCTFSGNKADYGGALYVYGNPVNISIYNTTFENNTAAMTGGAVFLDRIGTYSTDVNYYNRFWLGDVSLNGNSAQFGGAIGLGLASTISFLLHTTVNFTSNTANYGGAIYTTAVAQYPTCFVSMPCQVYNHTSCMYKVHMNNNVARISGTDVFLQRGQPYFCPRKVDGYAIEQALPLVNNESSPSSVSSTTTSVFLCSDGRPETKLRETTVVSYPGKTFTILAITTGYLNGITPASVIAKVTTENGNASILKLEDIQTTSTNLDQCSTLSYTVMSTEEFGEVTLKLTTENIQDWTWYIQVNVNMTGCPNGFQIDEEQASCVCADLLRRHGTSCNAQDGTVVRSPHAWIGYIHGDIVYYPDCPYDYCKHTEQRLNLSTAYPSSQCASNREGLLCGSCPANSSLGLGSSNCLQGCSNVYALLVIPFALAGIVLVLFLIIADLTISKGCLNGVIFYANIVWLNNNTYLPENCPMVLTIFLAWINLDLGVETCFFKGMDAYTKAWLQFVFPLYLWAIMLFMYIMSSWSTFFTKLIRKNSIQVLATLFLLSCTKLLRSIIGALSVGRLQYPNNVEKDIWLPDASIDYLSSKHVPLFLVGIFFLLLLVPYVLFLLLGQLLTYTVGRCGGCRRYIIKLQTFFEAYGGAFKKRTKSWIGVLTVAKIVILAVFASNYQNRGTTNLLAVGVITVVLLLVMILLQGLYRQWYFDVLEALMIFNLWCYSLGTAYADDNRIQIALTSVSVGLTLIVFLVTVAVHLYLLLPNRYRSCCRRWEEYTEPLFKSDSNNEGYDMSITLTRSTYSDIGNGNNVEKQVQ